MLFRSHFFALFKQFDFDLKVVDVSVHLFRHQMKEEMYGDIHDLQVKVKLLEEREKMGKK